MGELFAVDFFDEAAEVCKTHGDAEDAVLDAFKLDADEAVVAVVFEDLQALLAAYRAGETM